MNPFIQTYIRKELYCERRKSNKVTAFIESQNDRPNNAICESVWSGHNE